MIFSIAIDVEKGQSTTEYALILALVSGLVIFSLSNFGNSLLTAFLDIVNKLPTMS